jgi:hypothetical protein
VAFTDLAAEVQTEVGLLRATQAELARHARERESRYQRVDPAGLGRSLPCLAEIGGPAMVATMGQPISTAGNRLLRTTLVRAADNARRLDRQLARIYHTQMVERGKDHLGAVCVVAAHLAQRAWGSWTAACRM